MASQSASRRMLRIYLNDHLMGATAGVQLARRAVGANRQSRFEAPLQALREEIAADRSALLDLMRALDVRVNPFKVAAGLAGERLGRLKLNGRLVGYSPLSRLLELEGLHAGVNAKLRLWLSLARVASADELGVDLDRLLVRARSQLDRLDELRDQAAEVALSEASAAAREAA